MGGIRRIATRVAVATLLLCGLGAGAAASSAGAAPSEFDGQTLFTHAQNALSIEFGLPPRIDPQTAATAFVVDPGKNQVAPVNKPFYVGVWVYGIGDNGQGSNGNGGGSFYVEFVPPPGVTVLTNNKKYPPYWESYSDKKGATPVRQTTVPLFGIGDYPDSTLVGLPPDPNNNNSRLWSYTVGVNQVKIFIPVEAKRPLSGIIAPNCAGIQSVSPTLLGPQELDPTSYSTLLDDNFPTPCLPGQAGNDLQVAVHIADEGAPEWLVPWVDMIAGNGKALKLTVPARVPAALPHAGVKVKVANAPAGPVHATLSLGKRVLARATGKAKSGKALSLLLKPKRSAHLKAGSKLKLTVTASGQRATHTIRVR